MEPLFNKILKTLQEHKSCAVATVVASRGSAPRRIGAKMAVFRGGATQGSIGGGALEKMVIADALRALRQERSLLKEYPLHKKAGLQVCGGRVSIFIEVFAPTRRLVVAGGGHIGLALSFIAKVLDFEVVLVDNRRAFANKERFPHADKIFCASYGQAIRKLAPDKDTFIVIVTHGHLHDAASLEAALKTKAGYIGMIGSAAKIREIFGRLRKKGFSRSALKRVIAPVGEDIGAETAQEIAVAIAAQLVKISRKG